MVNKKNKTDTIEMSPVFKKIENPKDSLNQLEEISLKLKQDIWDYTIINSNWGLK